MGRYLESLLREWARSGLPAPQTHVVLASGEGLTRIPRVSGLTASVAAPGSPGLIWERFGLGRSLRPGDLLFAPANLIPSRWSGPSVLVLHDALMEARPSDFSWTTHVRFRHRYRDAARRADLVIVPSASTARDAEEFYGVARERIAVIPPAPDPSFRPLDPVDPAILDARKQLGIGASPFFLFAGKRSKRRNVPRVLEAFAAHSERFPTHRLVFVGDTSHPALLRLGGVIDAGFVSEDVLRGLYGSAIAVLYPSEHEGYGLPVVEAMASGCPVVTLRRDALIEAGGDGPIYLESASQVSLASAMERLAVDVQYRSDRIAKGLDAAKRVDVSSFAGRVREALQPFLTTDGIRGSQRPRADDPNANEAIPTLRKTEPTPNFPPLRDELTPDFPKR